jgi:hypothetical protein
LRLRFDPTPSRVQGTVAIEARIGAAPLASLQRDLATAMSVDSVRVDGAPASFSPGR